MIAILVPSEWITGPPGYPQTTKVRRVMAEGRGTLRVMLCGEAAGEHEDRDGLPFRPYAEAGSILERALYRAGIARDSLTITNLCPWRPPRNWLDGSPWEQDSLKLGAKFLAQDISRSAPKVLVALGGMAFRELSGLSGEKCGIGMTRGFIVPSLNYGQIPVIGTFHPSYLRRGSKERQDSGAKGKVDSAGGGTQGMALLGVLIRDLLLAVDVARNGAKEFSYDSYTLGGTIEEWREARDYLRSHPELPISYDFETVDSLVAEDESEFAIERRDVTQVQISWRPGQALVSSWFPDLLPVLREILELPNPKLDWNGRKFDRPILRDLQIRTDLGEWHDLMDGWHHAQPDLPRGLQFATSFFCPEVGPWKHFSASDPLWYGALDVDMPQRIFRGLKTSLSLTRHPISSVNLWSGYQDQVVRLAPVLDRMSARGIPVDESRRMELDVEFTATLDRLQRQMQGMVPKELKNISPKDGYVATPREIMRECGACDLKGKVLQEILRKNGRPAQKKVDCQDCGGQKWFPPQEAPEGWCQRTLTAQVKCGCAWSKTVRTKALGEALIQTEDCPECGNTGKVQRQEIRWAKVQPFLPGSWQQVLRYIEWSRGQDIRTIAAGYADRHPKLASLAQAWAESKTEWKVPIDHKTGRPTTAADELERLGKRTKDPLIPLILEHREVDKARGTYVRGWAGADAPNSPCVKCGAFHPTTLLDGCEYAPEKRVHPNFGFKPATPQLSSDQPNAQNFLSHGDLAKRMKLMIRVVPTHRIVAFDYKSFHVLTLGFEAQDPLYMRMARLDMHSYFALVGLLRLERSDKLVALPDGELREIFKFHRQSSRAYPEFGGATFEEIRNEKAKRAILGIGFGQQEYSLWKLNPESFASPSEARMVLDRLNGEFPKPEEWRWAVRMKADEDHQLVTRFGHVRRFWDVFERKPVADNYQPRLAERVWTHKSGQRWLLKPGGDHEAAVAYLPASDAFGIIRSRMVELGEDGRDEKFGLINQVHDSLVFDCPGALVEECLDLKRLLERPSLILRDEVVAPEGLWCAVEAKIGPSLGEMAEVG